MKLLMGAAALAAAMNAGAVGLSVVGGDVIAVAAVNNLITGGSYNIGGNVLLDFAANVTATYLGHEASYSNDFNFNGQTLNNKTSSVGDTIQALAVAPGLLEFGFYSRNVGAGVANGANRLFGDWQSFAIILDYSFNNVFYDAIVLFDDSGWGPDDNHDDHVIGLTVEAGPYSVVPLPAAAWLFGSGLLGLVAAARRRGSA